jgi:hypothetical protein
MADTRPPKPDAVRLYRSSARTPPRIPFGLGTWSDDDAAAIVVALESTDDHAAIADRLPDPATLADGTLVVVLGDAYARRGLLAKLLPSDAPITRHARATALLARGYTRIAAGSDDAGGFDVVWGYAQN